MGDNVKITIFTPVYNRKELLKNAYGSICIQKYANAEWVIMDDGSSDGTKEQVWGWMEKQEVFIKYYFQKNQGRFAAFNNARKHFSGEIVILLDSDNILLPGVLKKISKLWDKLGARAEKLSGIIAYMQTDGSIVGNRFPDGIYRSRIYTLYDKYKLYGDKALIFRNDILQKYAYPIFPGEKFGGDSIVFNRINEEAPMYIWRRPVIERGNPKDSITNNLRINHLNSPNGMREHYRDALVHEKYNRWNIIKHSIGYVSFSIMTGKNITEIIRNSPKKGVTFCVYPLGWALQVKNGFRKQTL